MYIAKANTRNMSKFLILHNRVKVHELFTLHKTKTPLLLFVLYPEDITARNGPMFYAKTAAKE